MLKSLQAIEKQSKKQKDQVREKWRQAHNINDSLKRMCEHESLKQD